MKAELSAWEPVVVQTENSWLLRNGIVEATICRHTGCISAMQWAGEPLLTAPTALTVRDAITGANIDACAAPIAEVSTDSTPKQVSLVLRKNLATQYALEIRYLLTSEALRWDVACTFLPAAGEVKSDQQLTDREVAFDLEFPVLAWAANAFWTADGAPYTLSHLPSRRITYRSGVVLPAVTVYNPNTVRDIGLSFIAPFEQDKPGLSFSFGLDEPNQPFRVSQYHLRLGSAHTARAGIYLVPHAGDWRPGLAWMLATYSDYFRPKSQAVLKGEGPYAMGFPAHDEKQIRAFADQGVTWQEYHCNFPFYGCYVPEKEIWPIIVDQDEIGLEEWENDRVSGQLTNGYRQMHNHIAMWHRYGIQVYMYLQSFEAWYRYANKYFPDDIARDAQGTPHVGWRYLRVLNPDPTGSWGRYIMAQLRGILERFPEIEGIFYDCDGYAHYDYAHDDGVTMVGTRPCSVLGLTQSRINRYITDYVHAQGKGIWANCPSSVEVTRGMDGLMAEATRPLAQVLQYFGVARPMICLPYDKTPETTEAKLKTSLACGYYPSATQGGSRSCFIEQKYRPLFDLMKGREWVLSAHALELPVDMEGNIFQAPNGDILVSVVAPLGSQVNCSGSPTGFRFGLPIRMQLPEAVGIRYCYTLSGDAVGVSVLELSLDGNALIATLPCLLTSALLVLSKELRYLMTRKTPYLLIRGEKNHLAFCLSKVGEKWISGNEHLQTPWGNVPVHIPSPEPVDQLVIEADVVVPAEADLGEVFYTLHVSGRSERMSAWVVDAVNLSGPERLFVSEANQGVTQIVAANHTDRVICVDLQPQLGSGGSVEGIPAQVVLQPFDCINLACKVHPQADFTTLDIAVRYDGIVRTTRFDVERALSFASTDLAHADFSAGLEGWRILEGHWEAENGLATGHGGRQLMVVGSRDWGDYTAEVTASAVHSRSNVVWPECFLFARVQDARNFYRFGIHGGGGLIDLYKCVDGDWMCLGVHDFVSRRDAWYTLRIQVNGEKVQGFLDGKLILETSDTSFVSGGVGLGAIPSVGEFDIDLVGAYRHFVVKAIDK